MGALNVLVNYVVKSLCALGYPHRVVLEVSAFVGNLYFKRTQYTGVLLFTVCLVCFICSFASSKTV